MAVAVVTEAGDTQVSAAGHTQDSAADAEVSAAALVREELVAATAEPALAVSAAMARGPIRPESQRGATAAIAAPGRGTMHREARLENASTVLA